jgi:hypothetical protein
VVNHVADAEDELFTDEGDVMPWDFKGWGDGVPDHPYPQEAVNNQVPQRQAKQRLGLVKMKNCLTPWGENFYVVPKMEHGAHPEQLDTKGQQKAWGFQIPGMVNVVFYVGTSVSSKQSMVTKKQRYRENLAGTRIPQDGDVQRHRTHGPATCSQR